MSTALITHTCFTQHDTGPGHPERPDRMRAIDRALERPEFTFLIRDQAPLRDDAIEHIQLAHPKHYVDELMRLRPQSGEVRLDPDTVMSPGTWEAVMRGVGNLWNCPLKPYDGGDKFKEAFESRILPALHDFAPDILFVSAGFDAHEDDPLANLRLREPDFAWATEKLAGVAAVHCRGRLVSMLEGGYDLNALARSVAAHVSTLMGA